MHQKFEEIKRILLKNGYDKEIIDSEIRKFLNTKFENNISENKKTAIKLFYKGQYHKNYKQDESVLKEIIKKGVIPKDKTKYINLSIYYKTKKSSQLVMKNNLANS